MAQTQSLQGSVPGNRESHSLKKEAVRARVEEIGIIPAVRVSSAAQARYRAEALYRAGIRIAEITMTVPGALELIPELLERLPETVVGAGTVRPGNHRAFGGSRSIRALKAPFRKFPW